MWQLPIDICQCLCGFGLDLCVAGFNVLTKVSSGPSMYMWQSWIGSHEYPIGMLWCHWYSQAWQVDCCIGSMCRWISKQVCVEWVDMRLGKTRIPLSQPKTSGFTLRALVRRHHSILNTWLLKPLSHPICMLSFVHFHDATLITCRRSSSLTTVGWLRPSALASAWFLGIDLMIFPLFEKGLRLSRA